MKNILKILFLIYLFTKIGVLYGEVPYWLKKPPLPDKDYIYFVGIKTGAKSIESGRERATRDAINQIVEYMGIKVSTRFVSKKTKLTTKLIDKISSYSKANIKEALIKEMYYEKNKDGKTYNVYLLIRYPKKEIEEEKRRVEEASKDYAWEIDTLVDLISINLYEKNIKEMTVEGFRELVSKKRYVFSDILENDLKTRITSHNINVNEDGKYLLTGTYRAQGNDLIISVNIIESKTKRSLFAQYIVVPRAAIEPDWLQVEEKARPILFMEPLEIQDEGKSGTLSVISHPIGAEIFLDGDNRGKTNVDIHNVSLGPHNLILVKDKHEIYIETVKIKEDEKSQVEVKLKPQTGALLIKTVPDKVNIYLDGEFYGLSPKRIENLLAGEHDIYLKKEGYKNLKEKIEIVFNELTTRKIKLKQEDGSLMVISNPIDAKVFLDSEYKGKAKPLFLKNVPPGKHVVRIEFKSFEPQEREIAISPFQTQMLSVNLKRARAGGLKIYSFPDGARVYIDGIERGLTPLSLKSVEAGKRELKIAKEKYQEWKGEVEIVPGNTSTVLKQLEVLVR